MRPQKLLLAAAIIFAGTLTVNADSYSSSIGACKNAIGERLGITDVDTRYNIKKIKSKARYQDIKFSVTAFDESHPVQGVKVKCRTKKNGEILAVEFDQESLPASIAVN